MSINFGREITTTSYFDGKVKSTRTVREESVVVADNASLMRELLPALTEASTELDKPVIEIHRIPAGFRIVKRTIT